MLLDLGRDRGLTMGDQVTSGPELLIIGGFCQTSPKSVQESYPAKIKPLSWVPPTSNVQSRYKGIKAQHFLQSTTPLKGHTSSRVPLEMAEAIVTTESQLNSSLLPSLLPSIPHGYQSQGHSSINFWQTNVHLRIFFPRKTYLRYTYQNSTQLGESGEGE